MFFVDYKGCGWSILHVSQMGAGHVGWIVKIQDKIERPRTVETTIPGL
jgi:hypothetical protein